MYKREGRNRGDTRNTTVTTMLTYRSRPFLTHWSGSSPSDSYRLSHCNGVHEPFRFDRSRLLWSGAVVREVKDTSLPSLTTEDEDQHDLRTGVGPGDEDPCVCVVTNGTKTVKGCVTRISHPYTSGAPLWDPGFDDFSLYLIHFVTVCSKIPSLRRKEVSKEIRK